eukprot:6892095-Prymnesium_polylepis.1
MKAQRGSWEDRVWNEEVALQVTSGGVDGGGGGGGGGGDVSLAVGGRRYEPHQEPLAAEHL